VSTRVTNVALFIAGGNPSAGLELQRSRAHTA
jgi:hypothetical protein